MATTSNLRNLDSCSQCGYVFELATSVACDAKPAVGSLMVCINCGRLHMLDEHMNHVPPDPETLAAIDADPELRQTITRAQLAIAARKGHVSILIVGKR